MTDTLPPPLFLLTCMRSYSSLSCGMLGQHPQMFGLPEVNLMIAERVGGLLFMLSRLRPASLHGLLRALAQVECGAQTDETIAWARTWLDQRTDWSTTRVLRHIAARVAPRRIVEKSPTTVMARPHLNRLLRAFPDARFLHVTRHPRPTGASILRLIGDTDRKRGTNRADRTDPERIWGLANRNSAVFLATLPPGQGMRLRGEDLVSAPETYLTQVCQWLGLRTDAEAINAMLHPEASPFACFGPPAARFGHDPGFMENPAFSIRPVPPASLDGPVDWLNGHAFSPETRALANLLGYT